MSTLTRIKTLIPGYSRKWRQRCAVMLAELNRAAQHITFSEEGNYVSALWHGKQRFFGFPSDQAHRELAEVLGSALPGSVSPRTFRMACDLIARYLYPHIRADLSPPGSVDQLHGFHGQHRDNANSVIPSADRAVLRALFEPQEGQVILEGGAFLGFGALAVAPLIKGGRYIAVEANSECFGLLQKNLAHSTQPNIDAVHGALWKQADQMQLATGYAQANTLVDGMGFGSSVADVRTVKIDDLLTELGLKRLDLLGLTINGAEPEALEGASDTLTNLRPKIRAAGWYQRDGKPVADMVSTILDQYDYRIWVGPQRNCLAVPREEFR